MTAQDVMPSVDMALWVSGLSKKNAQAPFRQRKLLYCRRIEKLSHKQRHQAHSRKTHAPSDTGENRTIPPNDEKRDQTRQLLLP